MQPWKKTNSLTQFFERAAFFDKLLDSSKKKKLSTFCYYIVQCNQQNSILMLAFTSLIYAQEGNDVTPKRKAYIVAED